MIIFNIKIIKLRYYQSFKSLNINKSWQIKRKSEFFSLTMTLTYNIWLLFIFFSIRIA